MNLLIDSIELLSNQKSLRVGIDTINNSWVLMHFKHLKIKNKQICYQRYNGFHTDNAHPKRWLKKPFKTTAELCGKIKVVGCV
jgi:hypothetical protein